MMSQARPDGIIWRRTGAARLRTLYKKAELIPLTRGGHVGNPGRLVCLAALLAGLAVVAEPGTVQEVAAETFHIHIEDVAFEPVSLNVQVGDTVTWHNHDSVVHTSTSDSGVWDSGDIAPQGHWSFTFLSAGVYGYHCQPHPSMEASITVTQTNQPPSVFITEPADGTVIFGTTMIRGSASDPEGKLNRVDVRIDAGPHQAASGTGVWNYGLDTNLYADGPHTIRARAVDDQVPGPYSTAEYVVANLPPERITSLEIETLPNRSVRLSWFGPAGYPAEYRLAVANEDITEDNFGSYTYSGELPVPRTGERQNVTIGPFPPAATYRFTIGSTGLNGKPSPISPIAFATIVDGPSAPEITEVRLDEKRKVAIVSWEQPMSDGGSAVIHYRVYRRTGDGPEELLGHVEDDRVFVDAAIERGVTYNYRIDAVNRVGAGPSSDYETIRAPLIWPGERPYLISSVVMMGVAGAIVVLRKAKRRDVPVAPHVPTESLRVPDAIVAGSVVLRCVDLTASRGATRVLHGVTFDVTAGGITFLLGESGSGKSTLLRMIVGLGEGSGDILLRSGEGRLGQADGLAEKLGYVPQEVQLYEDLKVLENVRYFGEQYGVPREEILRRARGLLASLGLKARENTRLSELSGGQRKRVSIACALIHEPSLLLMDEASSGLDFSARRALWALVQQVARERNIAVLASTHFLDDLKYGDQIILLHDQTIKASGSPQELVRSLPGDGRCVDVQFRRFAPEDRRRMTELESLLRRESVIAATDYDVYSARFLANDPPQAAQVIMDGVRRLGLDVRGVQVGDVGLGDVFRFYTGHRLEEA